MIALDILGATPTLGIGNPYAALASGLLNTAGGIASSFSGSPAPGQPGAPGVAQQTQEQIMQQLLTKQKAEADLAAAKKQSEFYRNVAWAGGAALVLAVMGGFVAFGGKKALA